MNTTDQSSPSRAGRYIAACVLATAGWALVSGSRLGNGLILMSARQEIDMTERQLALVSLLATGVAAVAAVPLGLLADATSRRKLLAVAGLSLALLANALRYFVASASAFLVATALEGIAYSALLIAAVTMLSRLPFIARGALIGGALSAALVFQTLLLALTALSNADSSMWRVAVATTACAALLLGSILATVGKDATHAAADDAAPGFPESAGLHVIASYVLIWFAVVGVNSFAATYLLRAFELNVVQSGGAFALAGLASIPCALAGGVFTAALIGASRGVASISMALAAGAVAMLLFIGTTSSDASTATGALASIRSAGSFAFACCLTALACQLPARKRGLYAGILITLMGVVQYVAPFATGMLSDMLVSFGREVGLRRALQVMIVIVVWAMIHAVLAWRETR